MVRLSSHNLCIKNCRYVGTNRNEKNGIFVENEFHFILQCGRYTYLQNKIYTKILLV